MGSSLARLTGFALALLALGGALADENVVTTKLAKPGGAIAMATSTAEDEDPLVAGRKAALDLTLAMGGVEPHLVVAIDCFEDRENKEKVLDGIAEVFGRERICGGACYGMFTQDGVADLDAVTLLGIGGDGLGVSVALEEDMGAAGLSLEEDEAALTEALGEAGADLARKLPDLAEASLMVVIADAHSPKNQLLLDGIQSVTGTELPITGGCVNENAGQNWVYFGGRVYTDSAVAVTLSGDLRPAMSGRQAKDNDAVIATAEEASEEALKALESVPLVVFAFDCAGRMGKLDDLSDELVAVQKSIGEDVPLLGCYCAGEFGPADPAEADEEAICRGRGWHIMLTVLGTP